MQIDSQDWTGLTEAEAARRQEAEGANELSRAPGRGLAGLALDVVREPMVLLLVAAGTIYLVLGDPAEALLLIASVLLIVGITLYQERKTERALEALRDLASPRALVIREGRQRRVAGRDVVRGDLLVLSEGDRVAADGVLVSALNLRVDESVLTGESVPVRKLAAGERAEMTRPGGEDLPSVYAGTLAVGGQGLAEVRATGAGTEVGRIGTALQALQPESTALQRETGRVVRLLAVAGLALCVLVVVLYGLTRGDWLGGLLAGITLAMSLIPEEFPVVLAVFLALGAWRISRRNVLARRMPAVEMLGATTVLCVDKTGTLTENRMEVARLSADGQNANPADGPLPGGFRDLVECAVLASQREAVDPMERAIRRLGEAHLPVGPGGDGWLLDREYPLSPQLLAMSHVWRDPNGQQVVAAKGAPEAIAELCRLGPSEREALLGRVEALAADGLRVLGVARAGSGGGPLPDEQRAFVFELLGLLGLADPVRPSVPAAIHDCDAAGIRVVMITGDYPGTARKIARDIGLPAPEEVITGAELLEMGEAELRHRIRTVNVFARVLPEQKLLLVNALKANGEVVAMTGDGVNDAPALKAADIGIAMGGRGTDVAREAAALVLLDDDFASIVAAVRLGRRIFDNLKKATAFLLAIHVPIAGMSLVPVLLNWPLALLPAHIVFLELVIDPVSSIVFEQEPEERDVMRRPPRRVGERLFARPAVVLSMLHGGGILLGVLLVYAWALGSGRPEGEARALAFTTLVAADFCLVLVDRSWTRSVVSTLREPNRALWLVLGPTAAMLALTLVVPALRDLFHFGPLQPADLALAALVGVATLVWFEATRLLWVRRRRPTAR